MLFYSKLKTAPNIKMKLTLITLAVALVAIAVAAPLTEADHEQIHETKHQSDQTGDVQLDESKTANKLGTAEVESMAKEVLANSNLGLENFGGELKKELEKVALEATEKVIQNDIQLQQEEAKPERMGMQLGVRRDSIWVPIRDKLIQEIQEAAGGAIKDYFSQLLAG